MRPIIKWPGGKSREFQYIKDIIPPYDRYIEPFFGGGAVMFELKPEEALINDISSVLMQFYSLVKEQNALLYDILFSYDRTLQSLLSVLNDNMHDILDAYHSGSSDQIAPLVKRVLELAENDSQLILNRKDFSDSIIRMVTDKFRRTRKNNEIKPLCQYDLENNLKTGFISGFYMYFRDIYNDISLGRLNTSEEYKVANFYYIREYCYGSMFRYNSAGEFNIPYGGISYNNKRFSHKLKNIFNDEIKDLFSNVTLYNQDFEAFMESINLTSNDFMFLDPPYDTEFSTYDARVFDKRDQERLAKVLRLTDAQFILIIKNTDFIYNLYKNHFNIVSFDKSYTYSVRQRNNQKAEHLIITNLDI